MVTRGVDLASQPKRADRDWLWCGLDCGYAAAAGGRVTVRVNTGILAFQGEDAESFDLLGHVLS